MDLLKLHSITSKLLDRVDHIEKVQQKFKITVKYEVYKLLVAGVSILVASGFDRSSIPISLGQ